MKRLLRRSDCPSPGELIRYQDGDLTPERRREIAHHLAGCEPCREYLQTSDEIGRLLRAHTPLVDDPSGRAELKRRLAAMPPSLPQPAGRPRRYLAAAVVLLLTIVAAGLVASSTLVEGGGSFTRWWSDEQSSGRRVSSDQAQVSPVAAPEQVDGPSVLPFGLSLTASPVATGETDERFYRNDLGLAIRVVVDDDGWVAPAADTEDGEIVGLAGHDVLVSYGASREEVMGLFWVDDDRLYSLYVLEQPSDGFGLVEAETLIVALMDEQ